MREAHDDEGQVLCRLRCEDEPTNDGEKASVEMETREVIPAAITASAA